MKLHKRIAPVLVPKLGPFLVRVLGWTWRVRSVGDDGPSPDAPGEQRMYCFWHGDLLVPMYVYRATGVVVLVSGHRDGSMVRGVIERMGYGTVVGSVTRGGATALRGLLSAARRGADLCVPPDGPRGPRGVVKKGVIFLASRAGLPVVPAGVAVSSAWRVRSWDRMVIPKPFARVVLYRASRVLFPRDADTEALEAHALELRAAIERAQATAESILAQSMPRPATSAPTATSRAGDSRGSHG